MALEQMRLILEKLEDEHNDLKEPTKDGKGNSIEVDGTHLVVLEGLITQTRAALKALEMWPVHFYDIGEPRLLSM